MLTCLDSNGIFLEFRLLWVGLGLTKAYKNEQYNTRLILDPNETFTVFPPIRPAGLIFSYFGNAGTISEQGSISVVTISWLFAKFLSYLTKKH